MSSEERKPKSTLPMQEAIGCEIFMMSYDIHITFCGRATLALLLPLNKLNKKFVGNRNKVLPRSGMVGTVIYLKCGRTLPALLLLVKVVNGR